MDLNLETVATIGVGLAAARLIGEGLRLLAERTPNEDDDRIIAIFLRVVDGAGRALAWVGLGNAHKRARSSQGGGLDGGDK